MTPVSSHNTVSNSQSDHIFHRQLAPPSFYSNTQSLKIEDIDVLASKTVRVYSEVSLENHLDIIQKAIMETKLILSLKNFTLGAKLLSEIDLLREDLNKVDLSYLKEIIRTYNQFSRSYNPETIEKLSRISPDILDESIKFEEQLKYVFFRLQELELSIYEKMNGPEGILFLKSKNKIPSEYTLKQLYKSILD